MAIDDLRDAPGFVYLASPYSKYDGGVERAFQIVSGVAADLIRRGVAVFSPIAHSHPIALHGGLDPLSHDIWLPIDCVMMDAAGALCIVEMDGWKDSFGVAYEIDVFRAAKKPIFHLNPRTLKCRRVS